MPNLNQQRDQDLEWIIRESDSLISIVSKDGLNRVDGVPAIIYCNVEEPPPYGYKETLSTKHHEITILQSSVEFPILNGAKVLSGGKEFTVHYVMSPESKTMTLYVR